MIGEGGATSEQVIQNTTVERLEKGESFIQEGFPTFEDFKDIVDLSNKRHLEYGIQLNHSRKHPKSTVYSSGKETSIVAPPGYNDAGKIFFHTHWVSDDRSPKSVISMTPSYIPKHFEQFLVADYGNNVSGLANGGYLNVISPEGVTFMIGVEKHTKTATITADIRKKAGVANETSAPLIIMKSGKYEGEIIDEFSPEAKTTDHLGESDHLAFTVRIPSMGYDYNMLFVGHDYLAKSEVTPEQVCFGTGINKIVDDLGIDIPHQPNLYASFDRLTQWATI